MKVVKEKVFTPITIVIENKRDADMLYSMAGAYINHGSSVPVKEVARTLMKELGEVI